MDQIDFYNLMQKLAHRSDAESADLLSDEFEQELAQALEEHPEWSTDWRSRETLDLRLAESMSDLEVPSTSKQALLEILQSDTVSRGTTLDPNSERRLRRRAIALLSTAALLFMTALIMLFAELSPALSVAKLQEGVPELWDQSRENEVSHETAFPLSARLPGAGWKNNRLQFASEWQTTRLISVPEERVAYRNFSFRTQRGEFHEGLLISLPTSQFSRDHLPKSADPFSSDIRYLSTSSGVTLAIVSWTDQDTQSVYLLAVPAEKRTLDALDAVLFGNPV